jgi:hypothetical protein
VVYGILSFLLHFKIPNSPFSKNEMVTLIKEHFLPKDNLWFQTNEINLANSNLEDLINYLIKGVRPDIRKTFFGLSRSYVQDSNKKAKAFK